MKPIPAIVWDFDDTLTETKSAVLEDVSCVIGKQQEVVAQAIWDRLPLSFHGLWEVLHREQLTNLDFCRFRSELEVVETWERPIMPWACACLALSTDCGFFNIIYSRERKERICDSLRAAKSDVYVDFVHGSIDKHDSAAAAAHLSSFSDERNMDLALYVSDDEVDRLIAKRLNVAFLDVSQCTSSEYQHVFERSVRQLLRGGSC